MAITEDEARARQDERVTELSRGERLKRRRLALDIKSVREFAEATGIDRGALARAEAGEAGESTYDRAEAWLDRMEEEAGGTDEPEPPQPLRLTMHGVYGIAEVIVEGPVDRPDELAAAVSQLLEAIKRQQPEG